MTKEEALKLLETAPQSDAKSRVNPSFSQRVSVKIVRKGIESIPDGYKLNKLFEKRVWQVVRNQIRPKF